MVNVDLYSAIITKVSNAYMYMYDVDHRVVCTLLQADNHTSTPPLEIYKFILRIQTYILQSVKVNIDILSYYYNCKCM